MYILRDDQCPRVQSLPALGFEQQTRSRQRCRGIFVGHQGSEGTALHMCADDCCFCSTFPTAERGERVQLRQHFRYGWIQPGVVCPSSHIMFSQVLLRMWFSIASFHWSWKMLNQSSIRSA